jgi:hypothetical protein
MIHPYLSSVVIKFGEIESNLHVGCKERASKPVQGGHR